MKDMYNMISDLSELKWFFENVIQKPKVNESYSAVFVSRHKKLTKEEQQTIGLTRKESEFLSTQTIRLKKFKDLQNKHDENNWTFEDFLKHIRRFNVDKYSYTTALGEPIPESTLVILFYINPCDDIKVADAVLTKLNETKTGIVKAHLNGKTIDDNLQSYQMFGNLENIIKHLKANCKGSTYWIDYDIDIPNWFKQKNPYQYQFRKTLETRFGKGNYVIVNTSGGYHILVKTSSIKFDPHLFCKDVDSIYKDGLLNGETKYEKYECNINNSQIPGIPLPGTYQYGKTVTILNKNDFKRKKK